MKYPNMTPRRWFWTLLAFAAIWCASGHHWDSDVQHPRWLRSLQSVIAQPAMVLLTPASYVTTLLQGAATNTISKVTVRPTDDQSTEQLRERVRNLEDQAAQLKSIMIEANRLVQSYKYLQLATIGPDDVVPATIVNYATGPGARVIRLDKGKSHGVRQGDAVIAPFDQCSVIGRVTDVWQIECEVQLLTDPKSNVSGQIIRPQVFSTPNPSGVQPDLLLREQASNVTGLGNEMQIDDISTDVDIRKGDLVRLADPHWPKKTWYMVIGQVQDVSPRSNQPLRYDIRISPRVPILTQRTVMILIKE